MSTEMKATRVTTPQPSIYVHDKPAGFQGFNEIISDDYVGTAEFLNKDLNYLDHPHGSKTRRVDFNNPGLSE